MTVRFLRRGVYFFWGEFLSQLFGLALQEAPFQKKRKPSVGQKILPERYKQNGPAIVIANCLVWFSVVVVIVALVSMLS